MSFSVAKYGDLVVKKLEVNKFTSGNLSSYFCEFYISHFFVQK